MVSISVLQAVFSMNVNDHSVIRYVKLTFEISVTCFQEKGRKLIIQLIIEFMGIPFADSNKTPVCKKWDLHS